MFKRFYFFYLILFLFSIILLLLSCSHKSTIEEIIIPEIKISNGGIQESKKNSLKVKYFNKWNKKSKSEIKLDNYIKSIQDVNRYMEVSGKINFKNITFTKNYFRSVIFEVRYEKDNNKKDYFTIPIDKKNRFNGYLYFRYSGRNEVYAYLFYDYLSYYGRKKINNNGHNTTASLGFLVNVLEEVPLNLIYLLPTENVDCGNKKLRDIAYNLTKDCTTDLEKAKTIYEYLVFGDKDDKSNCTYFKFKKYDEIYRAYSGNNFYNTFTASQNLENNQGICNDFAEVYAALMRALGYKVKRISGFTDETKSAGHMWNLLDLTGEEKKWIKVDASWGSIDKINYKKWSQIYPDFDNDFFENRYSPFSHAEFSYDRKIEY